MEAEEEDKRLDPAESVTGKLLRDLHVMHRGDHNITNITLS